MASDVGGPVVAREHRVGVGRERVGLTVGGHLHDPQGARRTPAHLEQDLRTHHREAVSDEQQGGLLRDAARP